MDSHLSQLDPCFRDSELPGVELPFAALANLPFKIAEYWVALGVLVFQVFYLGSKFGFLVEVPSFFILESVSDSLSLGRVSFAARASDTAAERNPL